jgi:hypothetical protein
MRSVLHRFARALITTQEAQVFGTFHVVKRGIRSHCALGLGEEVGIFRNVTSSNDADLKLGKWTKSLIMHLNDSLHLSFKEIGALIVMGDVRDNMSYAEVGYLVGSLVNFNETIVNYYLVDHREGSDEVMAHVRGRLTGHLRAALLRPDSPIMKLYRQNLINEYSSQIEIDSPISLTDRTVIEQLIEESKTYSFTEDFRDADAVATVGSYPRHNGLAPNAWDADSTARFQAAAQ